MRQLASFLGVLAAAAVAALWSACSLGQNEEQTSSCRVVPLPAPSALDKLATFPQTDAGLPILGVTTAGLPPGLAVALAYDSKLDDPVARWAECVAQVDVCKTSTCGKLAGCLDAIPSCADNKGGRGCCPPACKTTFHTLVSKGESESSAIQDSYLQGDCVDGFNAELAQVQP